MITTFSMRKTCSGMEIINRPHDRVDALEFNPVSKKKGELSQHKYGISYPFAIWYEWLWERQKVKRKNILRYEGTSWDKKIHTRDFPFYMIHWILTTGQNFDKACKTILFVFFLLLFQPLETEFAHYKFCRRVK